MHLAHVARLACLALLLPVALPLRAEESSNEESLAVREIQLEHVDVKEANAILRSILNVRKMAADERRQVLVLRDTPERLEEAAALLARIDRSVVEWTLRLVARSGEAETVLRTASIAQGRLEVHFGPPPVTAEDNLGVSAAIARASSGEIDMEWTVALTLGEWTESARAVETLHDGARVTLVATADAMRKKALAKLLGLPGAVESLVLETAKKGDDLARPLVKP